LPRRKRANIGTAKRLPALLEPDSKSAIGADAIVREVRALQTGRTTRSGRPLHVLDIYFDPPNMSGDDTAGSIRELELELSYYIDPDSDNLKVSIEYPEDLPWRTRVELEKKLTQLANENDPVGVFKDLRARAAVVHAPTTALGQRPQVEGLKSLVKRLESADEGTFTHWQQNLERAALPIRETLELYGAHVVAEVISGADRHVEVIKQMITSAQRQIVLACPFVHTNATWQFREEIGRALGMGRTIFLLLGMGDDLLLEAGVANWLYDLKHQYGNQIFFSSRSARCHAKFVIGDASDLLLTSYNFLGSLPGPVFEVGMRVMADNGTGAAGSTSHTVVARPALDLLALTKEIFPEYAEGQLISANPAQFGICRADEVTIGEFPRLEVPEEDAFTPERRALWKRAWHHYAQRLAVLTAEAGSTYQLVRNSEHRQLLFEALRTAEHRLLVLSDQLSTRVVNRRFVEELGNCLTRGVEVTLVYHRPERAAEETLIHVRGEQPALLRLLRVGSGTSSSSEIRELESHAKVLVCDNWAVVSSFNFLSFAGEYEGAERFDTRTEIGLSMHGANAVENLLTHVKQGIPGLSIFPLASEKLLHTEVLATETTSETGTLNRDLGALLDELSAVLGEQGASAASAEQSLILAQPIAAWFSAIDKPETGLAELVELDAVRAPFLAQAIAAYLSRYSTIEADKLQIWVEKLARELWWGADRCSHGVSLLLQATTLRSVSVPPAGLAMLDAFCKDGRVTSQMFEEAVITCDSPELATAIACLALPRSLFHEDPPIQALDLLQGNVDPAIAPWIDKCLSFRMSFPAGLKQLDLTSLKKSEDVANEIESVRGAFVQELQRCIAVRPDFKLGKRAWSILINKPGGLAELLRAAENRQSKQVGVFLHEQYSSPADELLDDAVAEAAISLNLSPRLQIIAARRRTYVDHLAKLVRLARAWVKASGGIRNSMDALAPDKVKHVGSILAKDVPGITAFAEKLLIDSDYRYPIVVDLLTSTEHLLRLSS